MKTICLLAMSIATTVLGAMTPAAADEKAMTADGAPAGFQPTPGMITMGALGRAGLLEPLFSDELQGLQQARIGASRTNVNYGKNLPAGTAQPAYKDDDIAYIPSVSVMKELPGSGGANFLRFTWSGTWGDGSNRVPLENDGTISRASAFFLHAPDPGTIYGIGLTYENSSIKNIFNADTLGSRGKTTREAWGGQIVYGHDFAGPWAIAAKGEYQKGTTNFYLTQFIAPGVSIPINTLNQGDDRLYLETQLIGTFEDDNAWVPAGWVVHPVVGATFQRNFIQQVTNTAGAATSGAVGRGESYGLLLAKVGIEKAALPSPDWQFLPRASVGLQQEYVNDLDGYLRDRTYATGSVGFGIMKAGQRLDMQYTIYQGMSGKRRQQALSAVLSFNF